MSFAYRKGDRQIEKFLLDASSADIVVGDAITLSGATDGYVQKVDAAAEAVLGIAFTTVASPSADGGAFVMVDISPTSIYEVGPDAGSVTQALAGNGADVGADAQSVDINGSTTADLQIVTVDVAANKMTVRIPNPSITSV